MVVALALLAILTALACVGAGWGAFGPWSLLLAPPCASVVVLLGALMAGLARRGTADTTGDGDLTTEMVARLTSVLDEAGRPAPDSRSARRDAAA